MRGYESGSSHHVFAGKGKGISIIETEYWQWSREQLIQLAVFL